MEPAPAVVVPERLAAPADEVLLRTLFAEGVQIYECRRTNTSVADWVFVAPEARLFDDKGAAVGTHGAGPFWQARDGSKILGTVKAKTDAPDAGAIAWLLLETHSSGGAGDFSKVTSVQRVATQGGVPPASGCAASTLGQTARVPYKAQYLMYRKKG